MKKIISILGGLNLLVLFALPVLAKGPSVPAGNSNKGHLYLYEKDPADWSIITDGAWGKMNYDLSGDMFDFMFNGHGLVPGQDYDLIYYPDPWPGNGLICLGEGTANNGGNVNISGPVETGSLPIETDANKYVNPNITGDWLLNFAGGTGNRQFRDLVQDAAGNVTGEFWWFNGSNWEFGGTLTGTVSGNDVNLHYERPDLYDYNGDFAGTIGETDMAGTFTDSNGGTYSWSATGDLVFDGGAKIWLVTEGAVNCDTNTWVGSWSPSEYLFEDALINFEQTQ